MKASSALAQRTGAVEAKLREVFDGVRVIDKFAEAGHR